MVDIYYKTGKLIVMIEITMVKYKSSLNQQKQIHLHQIQELQLYLLLEMLLCM